MDGYLEFVAAGSYSVGKAHGRGQGFNGIFLWYLVIGIVSEFHTLLDVFYFLDVGEKWGLQVAIGELLRSKNTVASRIKCFKVWVKFEIISCHCSATLVWHCDLLYFLDFQAKY